MAKMIGVKFTVEGSGRFPLDMLRYDRCFPATQMDVAQMQPALLHRVVAGGPVRIGLVSVRPGAECPTPERWESFGWKVVQVERTA